MFLGNKLPDNVVVIYKYSERCNNHDIINTSKEDSNALWLPGSSSYIIPVIFDREKIYPEIAITNSIERMVSLYFYDYLKNDITQNISVLDIFTREEYLKQSWVILKMVCIYRFNAWML